MTSRLVSGLGCEPLDVGDLRQARHLEAMAIVIIRLLFSGYDPYSVFACPQQHMALPPKL